MRLAVLSAAMLLATPAAADEVEDALSAALEAYRAGDVGIAAEEVEYAQQLLMQMKAASLRSFLPEPLEGWTRNDGDGGSMPGLGGMMASATYQGEGQSLEIQLMAGNQMVASIMMMLSNPAMIGQMGEMKRIGRQKVILTRDNELQAVLDNSVLVSISGSAPPETKEAYFQKIDLEGLKSF